MYIQTIDHQGLGLVTANKQPKPTNKNKSGQNKFTNYLYLYFWYK